MAADKGGGGQFTTDLDVQNNPALIGERVFGQGLVLQQTLALGARLDPEAVAQMEAADQRAARAESLIMTPVEPVKPPRHP